MYMKMKAMKNISEKACISTEFIVLGTQRKRFCVYLAKNCFRGMFLVLEDQTNTSNTYQNDINEKEQKEGKQNAKSK